MSVVLPTYNRTDALVEAVESVYAQTYRDAELVVVDDCSATPAADVLADASLLSDARVIRHEENRGGAAARNTGIEAASGEYLAFLDDDDRWREAKLAVQVSLLEQVDDAGVAYTGQRVVDTEGRTVLDHRPTAHGDVTRQVLCENVVGGLSVLMVEAGVVEAAGTLDERFPSWQDQEWYVRLSTETDFLPVAEPLVTYRKGNDSITAAVEPTVEETYPLFVEKYAPLAAEYGPLFERKMRACAAFQVGQLLAADGQPERARDHVLTAVRLYPFAPRFYRLLLPTAGGAPTYRAARRAYRWFDG